MRHNIACPFFETQCIYYFCYDVHSSCLGMCHYGLMIENGILIFLNAVGAALQLLYVVLYLLIIRPKVMPLITLHT